MGYKEQYGLIEEDKSSGLCWKVEEDSKDCASCGYGHYNDHWEMPFCYDNAEERCKNWNHWIPKGD